MANAAARRRTIRRLLRTSRISSQTDLADRLIEGGFDVTQATVSRDLKELGAIKTRTADGDSRYVLPESVPLPADNGEAALARALVEFAESIASTSNLVVVKTPPGAAQVVAAAIDGAALTGVLGTVAGDDTVLVVADEQRGGWRIAKELERIGAGT